MISLKELLESTACFERMQRVLALSVNSRENVCSSSVLLDCRFLRFDFQTVFDSTPSITLITSCGAFRIVRSDPIVIAGTGIQFWPPTKGREWKSCLKWKTL